MGSFSIGILVGIGVTLLFGALGKAFADWAREKWFGR
jgi:hypothetical protein